jgi:uncharacterized membrane protein
MSIVGALGAIVFGMVAVMLWYDPVAAGHAPAAIGTMIGMLVVGVILYLISYYVRRSQGIKIERVAKEIPIE